MVHDDAIRTVMAATAAAMAHVGSVSREEAQAMSGLDPQHFGELMDRVAARAKAGTAQGPGGFYDLVSSAVGQALDKADS